VPSAEPGAVDLWFMIGGRWLDPRSVTLSDHEGAGASMDHRVRDLAGTLAPAGPPDAEHLAILMRWHTSSWRDGEWLALDSLERIPYRKIVNAIGRIATGRVSAGVIGAERA
jgi:hypothetical protein